MFPHQWPSLITQSLEISIPLPCFVLQYFHLSSCLLIDCLFLCKFHENKVYFISFILSALNSTQHVDEEQMNVKSYVIVCVSIFPWAFRKSQLETHLCLVKLDLVYLYSLYPDFKLYIFLVIIYICCTHVFSNSLWKRGT